VKKKGDGWALQGNKTAYIYIISHDTHQIIARYHKKRALVGFSKI
jgi:hypothetical protein